VIALGTLAMFGLMGLSGGLMKRPSLPILFAIGLWILVPTIAAQSITHWPKEYHPSSLVVLAAAFSRLGGRGSAGAVIDSRYRLLVLLQGAVVVVAAVSTVSIGGLRAGVSPTVVNQYLAPLVLFVLILDICREDKAMVWRLRNFLLALAVGEALYSFVQGPVIRDGLVSSIPFASSYASQYWFDALERPLGTLDHPLVLGLLLSSCVPLVASIKRTWVQFAIAGLLVLACAAAYNRAATVIALFGLLYLVVRPNLQFGSRLGRAALLVMALVIAGATPIGEAFISRLDRLSNQDASLETRLAAYNYIWNHLWDSALLGRGLGSSVVLTSQGVLESSLESPLLVNIFEIGMLAAGVLLVGQFWFAVSSIRESELPGVPVAALACLVGSLTFNSTTTESACAPILWTLLALAVASRASDTDVLGTVKPGRLSTSRVGR
jgi:O-antigen ligase